MQTTSDWTDLILVKGSASHSVNVISTSGDAIDARTFEGHMNLSQPFDQAESGKISEAIFEVRVRAEEVKNSVIFEIGRGDLDATWVELFRLSGDKWIMVESFSWSGHSGDDRNASRYDVTKKTILGETK
jgi:hypothetical protein